MLQEKERKAIIALRETALRDPREMRQVRRAAGISVVELAGTLGVSRQSLYDWEGGTRRPSRRMRDRYYAALDLLKGEGDAESP